jgi:hypothetical protein
MKLVDLAKTIRSASLADKCMQILISYRDNNQTQNEEDPLYYAMTELAPRLETNRADFYVLNLMIIMKKKQAWGEGCESYKDDVLPTVAALIPRLSDGVRKQLIIPLLELCENLYSGTGSAEVAQKTICALGCSSPSVREILLSEINTRIHLDPTAINRGMLRAAALVMLHAKPSATAIQNSSNAPTQPAIRANDSETKYHEATEKDFNAVITDAQRLFKQDERNQITMKLVDLAKTIRSASLADKCMQILFSYRDDNAIFLFSCTNVVITRKLCSCVKQ